MHKKRRKKVLSILLIPDNEQAPRTLKIRYSFLYALAAVVVLVVLAALFGAASYGLVLRQALKSQSLAQENLQLKEQLAKVNQLAEELEALKSYGEKVRSTLQGYIKFVENPEEGRSPSMATPTGVGEGMSSIFASIPVLAPVHGFISQEFHWPVHNGIDIVAPEGTPIRASADGMVVFSNWTTRDGFAVMIHHDRGYFTYYKHNQRNLVLPYQYVHQGDVIALLGNSGEKSSGPHLHFEVWKDGRPLDPLRLIRDLEQEASK
ncbi:MAG: M23 family metallopeptidase [Calditrichaeota bacterium]|nr:MAG: M23 family metallopeptidase [Calditrichota bacterium]